MEGDGRPNIAPAPQQLASEKGLDTSARANKNIRLPLPPPPPPPLAPVESCIMLTLRRTKLKGYHPPLELCTMLALRGKKKKKGEIT